MRQGFCSVPVLFLVFNRPVLARKVFAVIRKVAPSRLYVACDGPREHVPEDENRVCESRRIIEEIDWQCEVRTLFREENLGCGRAVRSAIDWFFENEEAGIILEDDCIPDESFFPYCEELLARFEHDLRVMTISGNNYQEGRKVSAHSYYFSIFHHIWGWATWRRAWKLNDRTLSIWKEGGGRELLKRLFDKMRDRRYWQICFDYVAEGRLDTWDYHWLLSCWTHGGLCIIPEVNLVRNIGFGWQATHTRRPRLIFFDHRPMTFPLVHPSQIEVCMSADRYEQAEHFIPLIAFLIRRILRWLRMYSRVDLFRGGGKA